MNDACRFGFTARMAERAEHPADAAAAFIPWHYRRNAPFIAASFFLIPVFAMLTGLLVPVESADSFLTDFDLVTGETSAQLF